MRFTVKTRIGGYERSEWTNARDAISRAIRSQDEMEVVDTISRNRIFAAMPHPTKPNWQLRVWYSTNGKVVKTQAF